MRTPIHVLKNYLSAKIEAVTLAKSESLEWPPFRLAVLGNITTHFMKEAIQTLVRLQGFSAEFFKGNDEQLDYYLQTDSDLFRFKPQMILIVEDPVSLLREYVSPQDFPATLQHRIAYWESIRQNSEAVIIHGLAPHLPWEPHGHMAFKVEESPRARISRFNSALSEKARENNIGVLDAPSILEFLGSERFYDWNRFYESKVLFSFEATTKIALTIVRLIENITGNSKKCLIVDLDNTLWGGIIGDDGIEGICLGHGNPVGEAFAEFQSYIKELKERGVILAICSKNNFSAVEKAFQEHPDMVLKLDDFSAHRINWENKASNIQEMSHELNIGLDSIVFIDDNPVEVALVNQLLPQVTSLLLPENPAAYTTFLDQTQFFEVIHVSQEDRQRSRHYQDNAFRNLAQSLAVNYDEFLQGLEMSATLASFNIHDLPRIEQLVQRSNQWNLTTKRYTLPQIESFTSHPDWITRTLRLVDKYGDNGLITVMMTHCLSSEEWEIDTWLMSCRVLNRGVEHAMIQHLLSLAEARKIRRVFGTYASTEKNGLVRDLYLKLGAHPISPERYVFTIPFTPVWKPAPIKIKDTTHGSI